MLKSIAIVTLVVSQPGAIETAWQDELGYEPVHRGRITAEQSASWQAPAMTGQSFVILQPASGAPVYIRFIEGPAGTAPPEPGTTHGWNATELLVKDPDALARALDGTAFRVIGPPKDLWQAPNAPRAMQALGPAGELLYFTRILPGSLQIPMAPATTDVDRVFIMVAGGPSMAVLRDFYAGLGLPVGAPQPFRITVLSRALGLPPDTTFPLAVAPLPEDYLIELDEYPAAARPRDVPAGSLPPGVAMVSFHVEELDDLPLKWRSPPARIAEFPYSGQESAVTVGPAGEWLELVEWSGLHTSPGIPVP